MEQTWRWFGPGDRVTLRDAREAGAEGIVTALHEIPPGTAWPLEQIRQRQNEIQAAGLRWSVVESLDVSERIKTRSSGWQDDVAAFQQSLRNLSACGLRTVAYNLMPLFSWMRTHLHASVPTGGFATRFDALAFAAFDIGLLKRHNAEQDWGEQRARAAHTYLNSLTPQQQTELETTILQGLPGGNGSYTMAGVRRMLDVYAGIGVAEYRANIAAFLRVVCPVAAEHGMQLCVHPDDPPFPLLGLPRIVSTSADLDWLLQQSPDDSNGITFCTGALGVRPDNDLLAMLRRFSSRIGFLHLRSTAREPSAVDAQASAINSFIESTHLDGDSDLIALIAELVRQEHRRTQSGNHVRSLPFRADHGQELLNDRERGAHPGYPAVGRLRGLAELRGAIRMAERLVAEDCLA